MILIVTAVCAGALVVMALAQQVCAAQDARKFPPPGRMVEITVGGNANSQEARKQRLHVVEMGAGQGAGQIAGEVANSAAAAPRAVIFEAGLATSSLNWSLVQPMVAEFATAYSYDRAGLGWSPAGNGQCRVAKMVEELHALVKKLEIPGQYILAAHSFGGYIARAYAERYADELAGMVLVDPLTPEEWIEPTAEQKRLLRKASRVTRALGVLAGVGLVRAGLGLLHGGKKETSERAARLFGKGAASIAQRIEEQIRKLPPQVQRLVRMQWSCSKPFWTLANYVRELPACTKEVAGREIPARVPVTVISGGHQEAARLEEHAAMARNSVQGEHVVAKGSGHWIQFDEPDLIVEALRKMASKCDRRGGRDEVKSDAGPNLH